MGHCLTFFILWGILPFVLNSTGRYLKYLTRYFYFLHIVPSLLVCLWSIIIGIDEYFKSSGNISIHHGLAGLIAYFSIILILTGSLIKFFQHFGKISDRLLVVMKWIHLIFGILVTIVGLICCAFGVLIFKQLYYYHYLLIVAYIIVFALLEILFRLCLRQKRTIKQLDQNEINTRGYLYIKEQIQKGRKLMLYKNIIFDAKSAISHVHPASSTFLDSFVGTEITRYLFGGHGNKRFSPHNHSWKTIGLIQRAQVGIYENTLHSQVLSVKGLPSEVNKIWVIKDREVINSVTVSPLFYNPSYEVKSILPGLSFIGKYYMVIQSIISFLD